MSDEYALQGDTDDDIAELERKLKQLSKNPEIVQRAPASNQTLEDHAQNLEDMKKQNKELKDLARRLYKESGSGGKSFQEREKEKWESKVHKLQKDIDDLKFQVSTADQRRQNKTDKLQDIRRESAPLLKDESPLTQQIRMLENRLDKAMIKFNEATSVEKTYRAILKRYEEERLGFDNQLRAIEKTLKAKEADYVELQNLCHDAKFLKESTKSDLQKAFQTFEELKNTKQKELEEKRKYVQARLEMTSSLSKRENRRQRMAGDSRGGAMNDMDYYDTNGGQGNAQGGASALNESRIDADSERLAQLEQIWRKLKEAAGVDSINEVIQKFLSSNDTSKDLKTMTKEAQQKIDNLVLKKAQLKAKLEETKYSQSTALGSRRIMDEFEQQLSEAKVNAERNRLQYEKMAKVLVDAKAGISHLLEKLKAIEPKEMPDESADADALPQDASQEDLQVFEMTHDVDGKLAKLMEDIGPDVQQKLVDKAKNDLAASMTSSIDSIKVSDHNVRIKLDEDADDDVEDDDEDDDPTVEPSTRERIKQIAANETNKHKKANKKKAGNQSGKTGGK